MTIDVIKVGDFVRYGQPPYNVFRVNAIYENTIETVTVHGVYTEIHVEGSELLPSDIGRKAIEDERQRYLAGPIGRMLGMLGFVIR